MLATVKMMVIDTHLDTPVHFNRAGWSIADRHSFASDLTHVDVPRMREGGLDGGFFVVYTPQGETNATGYAAAARHAETRLAAVERVLSEQRGLMTLATRADDAPRIAATGRRISYISVENSFPLGDSVSGLAGWYARGVRMAGPVHSRDNQFADSTTGQNRWGGLSPLGRQWVAEMNRLGMVIDGSHSSDAALRQMMALSTTPVILSHSGFKAIYDHRRNVDDALAREVAAQQPGMGAAVAHAGGLGIGGGGKVVGGEGLVVASQFGQDHAHFGQGLGGLRARGQARGLAEALQGRLQRHHALAQFVGRLPAFGDVDHDDSDFSLFQSSTGTQCCIEVSTLL